MKDDRLISLNAAIDLIEEVENKRLKGEIDLTYAPMIKGINALPSAQPDIIACGDCIHWICHDRRCRYWNHGVKPLDWCCHAERRNDG